MKIVTFLAALVLAIVPSIRSAFAYELGRTRAKEAAQGDGTTVSAKIAIINTQEFGNSKTGIKQLIAVYDSISKEFQPQREEINTLADKARKLEVEIQAGKGKVADDVLQKKITELEELKKSLTRKQEDAQTALERRAGALTEPIKKDIISALETYSRQKGIDILLDSSKMEGVILIANPKVDLTSGFIADYNSKHP